MQNVHDFVGTMLSEVFRSAVFGLIIYEVAILYSVFKAASAYKNIRSPRRAEWEREVSEPPFPRPARYPETDETLRGLGITPLAILQVKLHEARNPIYSWVYRSEDTKTWVEVVFNLGVPVLVQFASVFPDEAMIMTRYPFGEAISTPNYRSSFARRSFVSAYNHHQQAITDSREAHGETLTIETLQDIQHFETIYRQKYQRVDYERLRQKALMTLTFGGLLVIANLLGIAALQSENASLSELTALVIAVLSACLYFISRSVKHPPHAIDDPPKLLN